MFLSVSNLILLTLLILRDLSLRLGPVLVAELINNCAFKKIVVETIVIRKYDFVCHTLLKINFFYIYEKSQLK